MAGMRSRIAINSNILLFGLMIYFGFFLNKKLSIELNYIINNFFEQNLKFKISLWLVIFIIQTSTLNILLWARSVKYVASLLIIITALADYYCYFYGVYFDRNMIKNILASNWLEAREFINSTLIWHLSKFALLPIIIIISLKISYRNFAKELLAKLKLLSISILIVGGILLCQSKNFYLILRNHKSIRDLMLPSSYLLASGRILFSQIWQLPISRVKLPIDPAAKIKAKLGGKPRLVVFVLGETVRAHNWGLSGYYRQTTPKLAKLPIINFPYAVSCGTNTNVSLPCMFSRFGRKNYNLQKIQTTETVLHLLDRLKVKTTWIDNQAGCKGVCEDLPYYAAQEFDLQKNFCKNSEHCLDEVLVAALEQKLKQSAVTISDELIILHQLGNHGPAYHTRFPARFSQFQPDCGNTNIYACKLQDLINSYDNAILYTDYILAEIIKKLANIKQREVFLIYVSDHGESLGENGIYLHGLPYKLAPVYQTRVPMIFWHNQHFPVQHSCLLAKAKQPADHDHIYHALLGLFGVVSETYDPNYDLLKDCYT